MLFKELFSVFLTFFVKPNDFNSNLSSHKFTYPHINLTYLSINLTYPYINLTVLIKIYFILI